MIKKLQYRQNKEYWGLKLVDGNKPHSVQYRNSGFNTIRFENGDSHPGVCINCEDKPCFQLSNSEVNPEILDGLPYNNDNRVCPSKAISADRNSGISIDPDQCINCGICVQRCPVGGIFHSKDETHVKVNKESNSKKIFEELDQPNKTLTDYTFNLFEEAKKTTDIKSISKKYADSFNVRFSKLTKLHSDLELILIRNYLIMLGVPNKSSAIGNNDIRLDILAFLSGKYIPGESELDGTDTLGLTRRVLEDIAYLESRKGIDKKDQIPIVVILSFPRKRSDFYEVITDIDKVTGIKIKTLTVHFLRLMTLFRKKLTLESFEDNFDINKENQDYAPYVIKFIPDIDAIDQNFGSELYTFSK